MSKPVDKLEAPVPKTTVMAVTMEIEGDPPFVIQPVVVRTEVQSVGFAIENADQTFVVRPVE